MKKYFWGEIIERPRLRNKQFRRFQIRERQRLRVVVRLGGLGASQRRRPPQVDVEAVDDVPGGPPSGDVCRRNCRRLRPSRRHPVSGLVSPRSFGDGAVKLRPEKGSRISSTEIYPNFFFLVL